MAMKNSNTFGLVAAVSALLCVFVLLKRRMRWGMLLLRVAVAAGEKWRESRDLSRLNVLIRDLDV